MGNERRGEGRGGGMRGEREEVGGRRGEREEVGGMRGKRYGSV